MKEKAAERVLDVGFMSGIEDLGQDRFTDINFSVPMKMYYLLTLIIIIATIATAPYGFGHLIEMDDNIIYLIYDSEYVANLDDPYGSFRFPEAIAYTNIVSIIFMVYFIVLAVLVAFLTFKIYKAATMPPSRPSTQFPAKTKLGREFLFVLIAFLLIIGAIAHYAVTVAGISAAMNSIQLSGFYFGSYTIPMYPDYEIFFTAAVGGAEVIAYMRLIYVIGGGFFYFILLNYGVLLVKRNKARNFIYNRGTYVSKFCLHRDAAGNRRALDDWALIPYEQMQNITLGRSKEYFDATKYMGSSHLGGGWYKHTTQKARYSVESLWLVLQTASMGTFGIPVKTGNMRKKTESGENVKGTHLEIFNNHRMSTSDAAQFVLALANSVPSADMSEKLRVIGNSLASIRPSTIV